MISPIQQQLLSVHNKLISRGYIVERVSRQTFKKNMEVQVRLHSKDFVSPIFSGFYIDTDDVECIVKAELVALTFACQAYGLPLPILEEEVQPIEITREDILHKMGNTVADVIKNLKLQGIDVSEIYKKREQLIKAKERLTKEIIADVLMAKPQQIKTINKPNSQQGIETPLMRFKAFD